MSPILGLFELRERAELEQSYIREPWPEGRQ
jgi:hypothetical protein